MGASDWINNEKITYEVGQPVWIIVDDVNSPTGRWKGEISVSEERESYGQMRPYFEAKLTDSRLEGKKDIGRNWIGNSPSINYRVMPRDAYTDSLMEMVEKAEQETRNVRYRAAVREEAFKEAVAAASGKKS